MIKYRVNESFKRDQVPVYSQLVPVYKLKKSKYWYNELGDFVPADDDVPFDNIIVVEDLVEYDKKNIQEIVDSYKVTSLDYLLDKFDLDVILNQTTSYTFSDNVCEFERLDKIDLASKWKEICNDFRDKNNINISDFEILKLIKNENLKSKDKINELIKEGIKKDEAKITNKEE